VALNQSTLIVGSGADALTDLPGWAYVFDISRGPAIPGDFNTDGTVDAADYVVWRNGLGTTYTQTDYNTWRANFGWLATAAVANIGGTSTNGAGSVPEPRNLTLLALSASGLGWLVWASRNPVFNGARKPCFVAFSPSRRGVTRRMTKKLAILVTLNMAWPRAATADVFWTEKGTGLVQRAAVINEPTVSTIGHGSFSLAGIAADAHSQFVFWGHEGLTDFLTRALFDGSQSVRIRTGASPHNIAVDSVNQKVYWADRNDPTAASGGIYRSNFDGGNVERVVSSNDPVRGLALDVQLRSMFWVSPTIGVFRSTLDGNDAELIVSVHDGFLESVAVAPHKGQIFWVDSGRSEIGAANVDGTDVKVLIKTDSNDIRSIAYEPVNDEIYWTDYRGSAAGGAIFHANSNGTNVRLFVSGLGRPYGLAIATGSRLSPVPGDFNNDGTVDAADYVVWRNGLGTTFTQSDYNAWRANFGGSAANAVTGNVTSSNATVPEPQGFLLLIFGLITAIFAVRGRLQGPDFDFSNTSS
jgi:hypothetical protein